MTTLWLIPVLPLLGSAFNGLLGKRAGKGVVSAVGVGTVAIAFVMALIAFFAMKGAPGQRIEVIAFEWMATGGLSVPTE